MHDDAAAVEGLGLRLADAGNRNDAKAFAAVFAEDADFTNVFGHSVKGRQAIENLHRPFFSEPRTPGVPWFVPATFEVLETRIRFLGPEVACADVKWRQTGAIAPDGQPWGTRLGLMNLCATRGSGRWEIAVFHNMDLPTSPPPAR